MVVYLNGRFVPESQAAVSIHDRGFLFGDGLFETLRAYRGEPFLWSSHVERFHFGCEVLRLTPPLSAGEILTVTRELLRRNRIEEAIIRISLSRGAGPRGYSPSGAEHPTFLIAAFPAPEDLPRAYKAIISKVELPASDPIAGFKHSNKLRQILARAEADEAGAHEAILLNSDGFAVEGTTTNLFWIEGKTVCTPPLEGILPGTTRAHVLELCRTLGIATREKRIRAKELPGADGLFLTSCAIEIMEVSELDGRKLRRSPIAARLKRNFRRGNGV